MAPQVLVEPAGPEGADQGVDPFADRGTDPDGPGLNGLIVVRVRQGREYNWSSSERSPRRSEAGSTDSQGLLAVGRERRRRHTAGRSDTTSARCRGVDWRGTRSCAASGPARRRRPDGRSCRRGTRSGRGRQPRAELNLSGGEPAIRSGKSQLKSLFPETHQIAFDAPVRATACGAPFRHSTSRRPEPGAPDGATGLRNLSE